jgi:HSP20 family molecular chaperone IbpA
MVRISPWYGGRRSWAPWRARGDGWDDETWHQELPVNIYDSAETWIITAPVPGMEPGDVELDCEGNAIVIQAKPKGYPQFPKDYLLHEWHVGPYHRRIELPREIEANACDASIAAGMLVIRVQKPEWQKVVHIPVRAAGQEETVEGEARETALASEMEAGLGQPAQPQGRRVVR